MFSAHKSNLILINQEGLFSNFNTCEVGISDHHHLVSTMLNKKSFERQYQNFITEIIRSLKKINL